MRFALIFCFTVCFSCQYFEKQILNSDVILEQELQTFKWDEVDQYPTFETCDEDHSYEDNKACFESIFTFKQSDLCIAIPLDIVTKPNISSPGTGTQHLPILTFMSS